MLQEFNREVRDWKREENQVADHLSHLETHDHIVDDSLCIQEDFLNEKILALDVCELPWYVDIMNLISCSIFPPKSITQ